MLRSAVTGGMVGLPPPPHARLSLFDSCHRKIRLISGGPVAFLGGLVSFIKFCKAARREFIMASINTVFALSKPLKQLDVGHGALVTAAGSTAPASASASPKTRNHVHAAYNRRSSLTFWLVDGHVRYCIIKIAYTSMCLDVVITYM
ncbi:unnamed protein product [Danaus chrysippus]|uniref:(African queen) hypothetical protein n=1 Tax=Danaus chrysippus TaxID=151541 RepID=A0A8J2QHM6_9NEOP|nr:unnamed protein product [Danaus chrysippus]